jgi:hypothetical protein
LALETQAGAACAFLSFCHEFAEEKTRAFPSEAATTQRQVAEQQSWGANVRFGSKADIQGVEPMSAITPKATAIATCQTVAMCH